MPSHTRLPTHSPYTYWSLGAALIALAVSSQLIVIISNVLFLKTSSIELLTYAIATIAVLVVPLVQTLLGKSHLLFLTTLACYTYCALITIMETLKTAQQPEVHNYQIALVTSVTGSDSQIAQPLMIFLIALSYLVIELLSRLCGAGIDLVIKGNHIARRQSRAVHKRERRV
jgi:hypothetical protein